MIVYLDFKNDGNGTAEFVNMSTTTSIGIEGVSDISETRLFTKKAQTWPKGSEYSLCLGASYQVLTGPTDVKIKTTYVDQFNKQHNELHVLDLLLFNQTSLPPSMRSEGILVDIGFKLDKLYYVLLKQVTKK